MLHAGSVHFKGHHLVWKTWAPLKVKIFLWLSFGGAIGLATGGSNTGSKQGNCATCVIKRWRPLTISSLHALTPTRYGTTSCRCCTDHSHSSPQQPSASGSTFEQAAVTRSNPAWTPCSCWCLGMCGKSVMQNAFAGRRQRCLNCCSSSRKKGIDGSRPGLWALEA
jgi:hypothetical protein